MLGTSFCLETLEFLGPNCNENEVYNVAFIQGMVPSDSIEDRVQKMGTCPRIYPQNLKNCNKINEKQCLNQTIAFNEEI